MKGLQALRPRVLPLFIPPHPKTLATTYVFTCLQSCLFQNVVELESAVRGAFRVAPFTWWCASEVLCVFFVASGSFLFILAWYCFICVPVHALTCWSTSATYTVRSLSLVKSCLLTLVLHLCCLLFYGLFFGAILETLTGGFLEVLWVFFCIWCKVWIKSFFKHGYPIFPASFVEKTILSPINYLYSKSTDYIYTCGSTDLLMYLYSKTTLFRLLYFYKNWSYIV